MPEDSLNQLLNNYQNMSMEDLGKSVLSRQATNRRYARRSMKRDEKIQKVLAVLLAGQAVFDKAAQHRVKEIDEYFDIVETKDEEGNILSRDYVLKENLTSVTGRELSEEEKKRIQDLTAPVQDPYKMETDESYEKGYEWRTY